MFVDPVTQIPLVPKKLTHHLRLVLIVSPAGHFSATIRHDDVVFNATDEQCIGREGLLVG